MISVEQKSGRWRDRGPHRTAVSVTAPLLEMHGIVKTFPGVRALDGVDLDVRAGEVHCLLGQNGAGKSTLIKVLAGAHQPDAGTHHLARRAGRRWATRRPRCALGIATIYQELDLVAGLSRRRQHLPRPRAVAVRAHPPGASPTGPRASCSPASATPRSGPAAEVGSLSAAAQQIVSMARALSQDAQLIIMDEPSAVLDNEEVERLFGVIRDLTAHGVAVVYISHRLEEIRQIGDRITVLKDGRTVATGLPARDTPTREVITLMTGRTIEYVFPPRRAAVAAAAAPAAGGRGPGPARASSPTCRFTVAPRRDRRAGRPGRLRALGDPRDRLRRPQGDRRHGPAGRQAGCGTGDVGAAVAAGVGLAPEERKSQGLLLDDSVYRNISISSLGRFSRGGFLAGGAETRRGARAGARRSTSGRPTSTRVVRTLSGGNQQKVVLARWLLRDCRVLLLDEPTRGVDVGAAVGDLRADPRAGRPRGRGGGGLQRDPGGAGAGRPRAGDRRRRRRHRGAGRRARRAPGARPGHGGNGRPRERAQTRSEGDVA